MVSSSLEELLFMGARSIGLFMLTDNRLPNWIESELARSIMIKPRAQMSNFAWKITLDRTTAMQLRDIFGSQCLAIRDYPIASRSLLEVFSLKRCAISSQSTSLLETSAHSSPLRLATNVSSFVKASPITVTEDTSRKLAGESDKSSQLLSKRDSAAKTNLLEDPRDNESFQNILVNNEHKAAGRNVPSDGVVPDVRNIPTKDKNVSFSGVLASKSTTSPTG
eukprot:399914-Amorphochlora_amoeboformis.AAC.1